MSQTWQPTWTKHSHLLPALRKEICAQAPQGGLPPFRLHDGREIDWAASPNGSDEGLLRFLQARRGDVSKAAAMFVKHLQWRRHAFPIHREGRVAEILDEALPHQRRRFAKMGKNLEGLPVVKQDFMWARFVTERFSVMDCVRAYILFIEENVVMAPSFLERQMVVISYGGFCPADWGRAFASMLQDNYPERLVRAVIWPVPGVICKIVRSFCYMFADKELNAKISIETEESRLLEITRLKPSQLPAYMQGGITAIMQRDKPDLELIRKMVVDGFKTAGKNHELANWPWKCNPGVDHSRVSSLGTPKSANAPGRGCFGGVRFTICGCFDRTRSPRRQNSTSEVQPTRACVEQSVPGECIVPCDVSKLARSFPNEYLLAAATFFLFFATLATLLSR